MLEERERKALDSHRKCVKSNAAGLRKEEERIRREYEGLGGGDHRDEGTTQNEDKGKRAGTSASDPEAFGPSEALAECRKKADKTLENASERCRKKISDAQAEFREATIETFQLIREDPSSKQLRVLDMGERYDPALALRYYQFLVEFLESDATRAFSPTTLDEGLEIVPILAELGKRAEVVGLRRMSVLKTLERIGMRDYWAKGTKRRLFETDSSQPGSGSRRSDQSQDRARVHQEQDEETNSSKERLARLPLGEPVSDLEPGADFMLMGLQESGHSSYSDLVRDIDGTADDFNPFISDTNLEPFPLQTPVPEPEPEAELSLTQSWKAREGAELLWEDHFQRSGFWRKEPKMRELKEVEGGLRRMDEMVMKLVSKLQRVVQPEMYLVELDNEGKLPLHLVENRKKLGHLLSVMANLHSKPVQREKGAATVGCASGQDASIDSGNVEHRGSSSSKRHKSHKA